MGPSEAAGVALQERLLYDQAAWSSRVSTCSRAIYKCGPRYAWPEIQTHKEGKSRAFPHMAVSTLTFVLAVYLHSRLMRLWLRTSCVGLHICVKFYPQRPGCSSPKAKTFCLQPSLGSCLGSATGCTSEDLIYLSSKYRHGLDLCLFKRNKNQTSHTCPRSALNLCTPFLS